jgi:arsenite methyltransferase
MTTNHIDVFDPPLCCASGVCGPEIDPLLAAFAADMDWLASQGVSVARHNLAHDPEPFVTNTLVLDLMQREGTTCLPLVLVNGEVLGRGAYPRREDLARAVGLVAGASRSKPRIRLSADGGCTPGSGCC